MSVGSKNDIDNLNIESLLEMDPASYVEDSSFYLVDRFYSKLDGQEGSIPEYMLFEEEDQVVLEFYNLDEAKRLSRVDQHGPSSYFSSEDQISRLSHVTGTMLLARKFDLPHETQLASLCHDIHPPFSHKGEIALGKNTEYHESKMNEVLQEGFGQEIEDYGLDPGDVLERSNHEILWNDRPKLSLDRTDYLLRDAFVKGSNQNVSDPIDAIEDRYGFNNILEEPDLDLINVRKILGDLKMSRNGRELEVTDNQSAEALKKADEELRENVYFCDQRNKVDSFVVGELRKLINAEELSHEDFFTMDDNQVFGMMMSSEHVEFPIASTLETPNEILQQYELENEHREVFELQNRDEDKMNDLKPTLAP